MKNIWDPSIIALCLVFSYPQARCSSKTSPGHSLFLSVMAVGLQKAYCCLHNPTGVQEEEFGLLVLSKTELSLELHDKHCVFRVLQLDTGVQKFYYKCIQCFEYAHDYEILYFSGFCTVHVTLAIGTKWRRYTDQCLTITWRKSAGMHFVFVISTIVFN